MKPVTVDRLPDDAAQWLYEIKFDGYRDDRTQGEWDGETPFIHEESAELSVHRKCSDGFALR